MAKTEVLLYGANGYTGQLIIEEALKYNLKPILAGRNAAALAALAAQYKLPYRAFSLDDTAALINALETSQVVIHAAGPFSQTARPMIEACIKTKTHYLDITGEHEVFELAAAYDAQARAAGIMLMSGTGFDVVPSDCLALTLKQQLPDATHLQLAFTGLKSTFSRGTAKTMTESMGKGGTIRENGKLKRVKAAYKTMTVNYQDFQTLAVTIPWGDLATAYRSTGIPNIEVYMGATPKMVKQMQQSNKLGWLLQTSIAQIFLKKQIDKRKPGPDAQQRKEGRSYFWGQVRNAAGHTKTAVLKTPEGYNLTAQTAVRIAQMVMQGQLQTGYQTPAMAYGADFILSFERCSLKMVEANEG